MRRRRKSTSVKINQLPDNLLEQILTFMPIYDAVKTSVLSRRWRNIWKKIPKLTFDNKFCRLLKRRSKRKLSEIIYQIMSLHDGPIISFLLKLFHPQIYPELDNILLLVSKRGIKEFTLKFKYQNYRLPSSIFSCQQLENLNLRFCIFSPPDGFEGFRKLVSLALVNVSTDTELFSSLIRNCPFLENFVFESSTIYNRLELFAPKLKSLAISGLFKFLYFNNTPKLTSIKFDVDESNGVSEKCVLSGRLSGVENLTLDNYYAEYMTENLAPDLLVSYLCNLKTLCLWGIWFLHSGDVSSVIAIINKSPKLEKLTVSAHINDTRFDSIRIDGWDITFHHLREVEFLQVSGWKCELQFIELLLANSPFLKKLVLEPNFENVLDKGLKFFKELSTFRRSSTVKIVYKV